MSDEFTFKLDYPLTQKQIDVITDAELEHTSKIWFTTRSGKEVEFVKAPQWIPCEERLPSRGVPVLVSGIMEDAPPITISTDAPLYYKEGWINAWMPLPEPYEEEK